MGEFQLIAKLREILPGDGPIVRLGSGDDAAVTVPPGATATSIDAIAEGVHFTRPEFPPEAIGHKALAAALSDLAAMGASPGEAYVALGLPEGEEESLPIGIAEGMARLAKRTGVSIAGGDVIRSATLTVTVTVVGHEPPELWLVSRSGARPGDVAAVTGELGGAAAALALLSGDETAEPPSRAAILSRQLAPEPRIGAGAALAAAGATAMIDISDGLGADAGHLAQASGARLEIEMASVPVQPGVEEVAGSESKALEMAASGGEDFELLCTLPPASFATAAKAVAETGTALTAIGVVVAGQGVGLLTPGGEISAGGWNHLRG